MITRDEAIDRALEHITRGLRRRLEAFEGWPGEAQQRESRNAPELLDVAALLHDPDAHSAPEPDAPTDDPCHEIVDMPRRVWRVRVPGDVSHVGSDRYVIVDAETGRVFTEMNWGE